MRQKRWPVKVDCISSILIMTHQENPVDKTKISKELTPDVANKFEKSIRPELDKYLPKLIAFCSEVLRRVEETGKTAVFIGRDGRGLLYLSKFLASKEGPKAKLKFIDLSHFYIELHNPERRIHDYKRYFKTLAIDPERSFFVDVGFRGTVIEDIRNQIGTRSIDDMLLIKEPGYANSIYGFTEGSANGTDENSVMGHFLENIFGGNIEPVDELVENKRGHLPPYMRYKDEHRKEIEHMVVQYFRKATVA